mmetsp:Transcript_10328/g.18398  ORF Transcript_10328/g.18398 Transcript_10328/m.18398 type:complete len:133 (+) Transcript_10328:57-455(+)
MAAQEQLHKLHKYTLRRMDNEMEYRRQKEAEKEAMLLTLAAQEAAPSRPATTPLTQSLSRSGRSRSSGQLSRIENILAEELEQTLPWRARDLTPVQTTWTPCSTIRYPASGWWAQEEVRTRPIGKKPWWLEN